MGAVMRYQPQGLVRINCGNPITRGLVSLVWAGPGKPQDILNPNLAWKTHPDIILSAGPMGVGRYNPGSKSGVYSNMVEAKNAQVQRPLTMVVVGDSFHATGHQIAAGMGDGYWSGLSICSLYGFPAVRMCLVGQTGSMGMVLENGKFKTGVLGVTMSGTNATLYDGGKPIVVNNAAPLGNIDYGNVYGRYALGGSDPNDGNIGHKGTGYYVGMWNRALSAEEMRSLAANPWQLFQGPEDDLEITTSSLNLVRALSLNEVGLHQITDAQVGLGLRPLVWYNGQLQLRVASEGVPVVLDQGQLRALAAGEILLL